MGTELWISAGITGGKLHYHADEHFHCLLDGRKDIILIERKYESQLQFEETVSADEVVVFENPEGKFSNNFVRYVGNQHLKNQPRRNIF